MPPALLFDLDGTLISNSMETFLPGYFGALTKKLAALVPAEKLITQLNASTRLMMTEHDATLTNAEIFNSDFFAKVGVPRQVLMPQFDDFYECEYRDLRIYVSPVENARDIVARAFALRYPVVIATAPVFPLSALRQRLEWGGLADFPYALITDYATMHSSKPHAAYYTEIAARLQRPPGECVMVGNDVRMDILPARRAGMKTFWVTEAGDMPTDVPCTWRGTLDYFGELLESGELA